MQPQDTFGVGPCGFVAKGIVRRLRFLGLTPGNPNANLSSHDFETGRTNDGRVIGTKGRLRRKRKVTKRQKNQWRHKK